MSEDSAYADFLMRIADILPLVINMTSVVIGIIGGICNLITFTAPNLRNNATVFYLLCATVFQTLCLIFPVSTRMALDNFGNNLEQESLAFCKLRYYVAIVWPQLVTSYILLATADRYFATSNSVRVRAWSNIKVAMRLSIIVLIGSHAMSSHSLVFYEIRHNACQVPPGTAYTIFFAVYLIFVISVAPHCAMFVFSILTFRNLRLRTQVVPLSDAVARRQKRQGLKRFEVQLITTIAIQVILSTVLVLLRLCSYSYSTITSGWTNKSSISRAAEVFSLRLGIALYYLSFALSFYVSTLASKYFRLVFRKSISNLYQYCLRRIR